MSSNDYYKQKQWNILAVTIITEIMNSNRFNNRLEFMISVIIVTAKMAVAMALAASTCVWRSRLIMKNAIFRAIQRVCGKHIHVL